MSAIREQRTLLMILKPQDIVILLKLTTLIQQNWTIRSLASDVFISPSEVSEGLKRAAAARLIVPGDNRPRLRPLEELLIYGVKYVFPPDRGGLTRGMPTAHAAPPLRALISSAADPPVWPHPMGETRGYAFSPLYKTVPEAAAHDGQLYELLALVDALREGGVRESVLAVQELKSRLQEGRTERDGK